MSDESSRPAGSAPGASTPPAASAEPPPAAPILPPTAPPRPVPPPLGGSPGVPAPVAPPGGPAPGVPVAAVAPPGVPQWGPARGVAPLGGPAPPPSAPWAAGAPGTLESPAHPGAHIALVVPVGTSLPPAPGAWVGDGAAASTPVLPVPLPERRRRWLPKGVRRIAKLLLIALVIEYLVLPQIAGTRKAIALLGRVNGWYLLIGVALEAASWFAYTRLTRAILPAAECPSNVTLLRIQLSTLSVSHVVPGGSAAGTSLGYRMLTSAGVDGPDAGFALATQGLGSAVVLNILLWIALVISIPFYGFSPLYLTAAIVGAVLIGGFSALVALLTKGEERASVVLGTIAARLPFVDEPAVGRLVHRLAARLRGLGSNRRLLAAAIGWAAANWLLDAASLWVFVAAFGHRVAIVGLLVSFGLANVLAAIPLTPGGLGVIEAVLTSTLVGFGTARGVAVLGVLSYRLVNFWVPIPLGGLAFVSLQVDPGDTDLDRRKARRSRRMRAVYRVLEPVIGNSESGREWARRHGIKV